MHKVTHCNFLKLRTLKSVSCKAAYIESRRLSSCRQYLNEDATRTQVSSCILSRLGYCNFLLAGYPQTIIKPLQRVQNSAAKLILKSRRAEHDKPLLKHLHWLPTEQGSNTKHPVSAVTSSLALSLSTWLTLSKSIFLLGLCGLLPMMEPFACPPSNENSMVVESSVFLLYKPGIFSLSFSVTALLSLCLQN